MTPQNVLSNSYQIFWLLKLALMALMSDLVLLALTSLSDFSRLTSGLCSWTSLLSSETTWFFGSFNGY